MKEILMVTRLMDGRMYAKHCGPAGQKSSVSRKFWKVKERDFEVKNPEKIKLEPGEYAQVEIDPSAVIGGAFLLFILPLICFLIIYSVLFFLPEVARILLSFAGMGAGFYLPTVIGRKKADKLPVVKRKATRDELNKSGGCGSCGLCG